MEAAQPVPCRSDDPASFPELFVLSSSSDGSKGGVLCGSQALRLMYPTEVQHLDASGARSTPVQLFGLVGGQEQGYDVILRSKGGGFCLHGGSMQQLKNDLAVEDGKQLHVAVLPSGHKVEGLLGPTMKPPFKAQLLDPRAVPEAATEGSCDLRNAELVRRHQATTWHATNLGKWLVQQRAEKGDFVRLWAVEGSTAAAQQQQGNQQQPLVIKVYVRLEAAEATTATAAAGAGGGAAAGDPAAGQPPQQLQQQQPQQGQQGQRRRQQEVIDLADDSDDEGEEQQQQQLAAQAGSSQAERRARKEARGQLDELQAELEAERRARKEVRGQLDELQADLEAERSARHEARGQLDELQADLEAERRARKEVRGQLDELQADLEAERSARHEARGQLDELQADLEAERRARKEVRGQLDELQDIRAKLEATINSLKSSQEITARELVDRQGQLRELESRAEKQHEEAQHYKQEAERAACEMASLRTELDQAHAAATAADAKVAQLSSMVANYEATCKELDMTMQVALAKARATGLEEQVAHLQDELAVAQGLQEQVGRVPGAESCSRYRIFNGGSQDTELSSTKERHSKKGYPPSDTHTMD
ncbi:hypothetical protein PLESTB_001621300 [Pleodorina starrii]|uniref:Uncharacterized protein n=1 Tax=Pleodorina starrii TaxID=330485 RepID=A0A9W6F8M6_9CHLO|nr:hypothetical protein PLESTM_001889700 [Pleodorina starrii]GLC60507.1 hypothetical protein PLESTB_001621300 [Pleodorina starrii]